jgi:hypothetical protein
MRCTNTKKKLVFIFLCMLVSNLAGASWSVAKELRHSTQCIAEQLCNNSSSSSSSSSSSKLAAVDKHTYQQQQQQQTVAAAVVQCSASAQTLSKDVS